MKTKWKIGIAALAVTTLLYFSLGTIVHEYGHYIAAHAFRADPEIFLFGEAREMTGLLGVLGAVRFEIQSSHPQNIFVFFYGGQFASLFWLGVATTGYHIMKKIIRKDWRKFTAAVTIMFATYGLVEGCYSIAEAFILYSGAQITVFSIFLTVYSIFLIILNIYVVKRTFNDYEKTPKICKEEIESPDYSKLRRDIAEAQKILESI